MIAAYLSYARQDQSAVEAIQRLLSDGGITVLDNRALAQGIPPGVSFSDHIRSEIAAAKCFILLWSSAAAISQAAKGNIARAIEAWSSGRLLVAALDDTQLPLGLRDLPSVALNIGPDGLPSRDLLDRAQRIVQEQTDPQPEREVVIATSTGGPPPHTAEQRSYLAKQKSYLMYAAGLFSCALVLFVFLFDYGRRVSTPVVSQGPPIGLLVLLGAAILLFGVGIGALALAIWQRVRRTRSIQEQSKPITVTPAAKPAADGGQVFVSYSRRNQEIVDQVVQEIEQVGFPVWIDRKSTGSGRYAAPIVQAIKNSTLVALMCSSDAFSSDHVIREIYVAGDHRKPFIVFQIDQSEFPDDVLYFTTGFPRIPVDNVNLAILRSELTRLVAA